MDVKEWLGKDNRLGYDIWTKKYQQNGETFDEWLDRVSGKDSDMRKLILQKKFLFGGRILASRGLVGVGRTLSNCYVIPPVEDSIEGIYEACQKLARTFSYGGGCGIDISKLRPRGARVNNAAATTTGAVSFMPPLSMVSETIGQQGRRGATMISIDINHPDVPEFVDVKRDLTQVTGANISIRVSDEFMHAVNADDDYILNWPCECVIPDEAYQQPYDTLWSDGGCYYKRIRAKKLFMRLCENNWDYAEPGILFWDSIKDWNLLSDDPNFSYAGVNPCAEEPLPAYGACLLGSLNLDAFVRDGQFNMTEFKDAIRIAIRGLNDVLDEGIPLHPLAEQREMASKWRPVGLIH